MDSPQVGPQEVVFENQYLRISRIPADFGSFSKEYFVLDSGHRAGMVAVREGSVLLVRQYRLLINGLSWEIPGGKVDEGETPEEAAVRECLEEAGVMCLNPQPLISYQSGLDVIHNPTHLFYSEQVVLDDSLQNSHPNEICSFDWIPLSKCNEMIFRGQLVDAFSILAIFAYQSIRDGSETDSSH